MHILFSRHFNAWMCVSHLFVFFSSFILLNLNFHSRRTEAIEMWNRWVWMWKIMSLFKEPHLTHSGPEMIGGILTRPNDTLWRFCWIHRAYTAHTTHTKHARIKSIKLWWNSHTYAHSCVPSYLAGCLGISLFDLTALIDWVVSSRIYAINLMILASLTDTPLS